MLSFQLRKEALKLLTAFEEAEVFFTMLNATNSSFPEIDKYLVQIGEGGDKAANAANQLRNHLAQLRNVISDINIRSFYSSLENFQLKLRDSKEYGLDDLNIIDGISNSIDSFAEKFESFIGSYTPQTAAPVITEARKLTSMLNGFKTALIFFESNLEQQHYGLEGHEELSILLPSSMNLQQFATKLLALDSIYYELCSLLNVSTSEHPLSITKIESGSLWVKIIGNAMVIGLMVDFIMAAAKYIYRNYTREGKLSAIPRKIDIINSALDFTTKLEDQGINTSEAKEHIAKSAVSVCKELNSLLDGQSEITVNSTTHSIGAEVQKQLLESDTTLKLQHMDDDSKQDSSK